MIDTQTTTPHAQPLATARPHEVRVRGPRLPRPPSLLARLRRNAAPRKPAAKPCPAGACGASR